MPASTLIFGVSLPVAAANRPAGPTSPLTASIVLHISSPLARSDSASDRRASMPAASSGSSVAAAARVGADLGHTMCGGDPPAPALNPAAAHAACCHTQLASLPEGVGVTNADVTSATTPARAMYIAKYSGTLYS